jgi:undecaprenyl-diphosphatase
MQIDSQVVTYLAEHRTWLLDRAALATMYVGSHRAPQALIGLVGFGIVMWMRNLRLGVATGSALILSTFISEVMKGLIGRHRPPPSLAMVDAAGSSFPSGVAAMTAAVAIAFFLVADWPTPAIRLLAALALTALVLWINFCVVYLGVHWPTDIIAGWLLGGVIGVMSAWLVGRPRPSVA